MQNTIPMRYTLRELRARKGWTQAQTAKEIGVSAQTYCAWENDFGKVKARDGWRVASAFGVTLDQIFFTGLLENNSSNSTPDTTSTG